MKEVRERWGGRLPFVMAAVGSAVGLGNIWRFPKVVYANDGGVFLIPYFIALISAGIPLMIVEYALGQKYQGGAPQAMAAVTRKFKWVGWFALLVGTVITFYYVVIMAWSFHYMFASVNVAWARPFPYREYTVNPREGTIDAEPVDPDSVEIYYLYRDEAEKKRVESVLKGYDVRIVTKEELDKLKKVSPGKKYVSLDENIKNYFFKRVLDYPAGTWKEAEKRNAALAAGRAEAEGGKKISLWGHLFTPAWHLYVWAFVTWALIFLIIYRGVHNVGKVVMFTVPIPVLIILVLIVRGLTLPGALDGIAFYLTPNWSRLTDPNVWIEAYGQIFFSLSLGFGILIAYASYMPHDSDITNNAFLTSFANCSTSFLGGFAVFSVLGYLAHMKGVPVRDVSSTSIGLAFITYPAAIAQMGAFWGVVIGFIFFLCLLTLGIDSAFSIIEGVITGVRDNFRRVAKPLITGIFCLVGFLVTTLVFASRSGLMWLDIADNWMSNYGLPLVGLMECIMIGYFSDIKELKDFINAHSEIKVHYWFDAFIKVITPGILLYLLGNRLLADMQTVYGGYDPLYVRLGGWGLFAAVMVLATIFARNRRMLAWELGAGGCFLVFHVVYRLAGAEHPATLAAMTTLGTVLLLGGFIHCLYIALTEKLPAGTPAAGKESSARRDETTAIPGGEEG